MRKIDFDLLTDEAAFYAHVRRGYDELAPTYDLEIGRNAVGTRMRAIFREVVSRFLPARGRVLDIGCGTGLESLWLARKGFEVVATDISDAMLEHLRTKASDDRVQDSVQCRRVAAGQIGDLAQEFGERGFDGAISHAGAFNMEPRMDRVPDQLSSLLKEGSPVVCSVINQTSFFEVVFYMSVLRPRKAFRRLGNVVPIPVSRQESLKNFVVPARFYTPREIQRLFRPQFRMKEIRGLQILLPPSNLTEEYDRLRPLFAPAEALERHIASTWPFREWGHHTIFAFKRR